MRPEFSHLSESDRLRLAHIIKCAHDAVAYLGPMDAQELAGDGMRTRAIVNCFTEIGEAARQVSSPLRERTPDIPWREMVKMRNVVVHLYWSVDLTVVVDTVRNHLPALIAALEKALQPPPAPPTPP